MIQCRMMDNQAWPKRKRIRLPANAYSEMGRTWHVTLALEGRDPAFAYLPARGGCRLSDL